MEHGPTAQNQLSNHFYSTENDNTTANIHGQLLYPSMSPNPVIDRSFGLQQQQHETNVL